ncbi:MAG: glycosyltransferase family 1 protein [Candidatus Andersenbacteria bacterium]
MSKIAYITNAGQYSGVGHRAHTIQSLLTASYGSKIQPTQFHLDGLERTLLRDGTQLAELSAWPGQLNAKSIQWVRLGQRLKQYVRAQSDEGYGLFHFTNQTLSFLARQLRPSVVTVHDIIELTDPQDKQAYMINRYLYRGIPYADHIICVSDYTKRAVQDRYDIPDEHLSVIYNGAGDAFQPIPDFKNTVGYQRLRKQLGLSESDGPIVLYVGSDHARKNVVTAIRAFKEIQIAFPDAVFVKVGAAGISAGRKQLLRTIEELHLQDAVRIIDTSLSDEELNEFYNLADVFVFPSTHEGFGLPPLQAMAAGTPVVCSNATSLPEVVGSAALTHDPKDIQALADHVLRILKSEKSADDLRAQGLERAKLFSWEKAVNEEFEVYRRLI